MGGTSKSTKTVVSREYENSPVSHILKEILHTIAMLRIKYPETDADDMDKMHADKLVASLETAVTKFHVDILPKFNAYEKPGLLSILKDLFGLRNMDAELYTRKYTLFLDVKKILPDILEEALKTPEITMADSINQALTRKKDDLFEKASLIPGLPLDTLLKEIIDKTHSALVSNHKFDDQKGVERFLASVERSLFPSSKDISAFVITHPMTFELAQSVILLLNNAPEQLKDLMPFLNPEAMEADLHSGWTGGIVQILAGKTYISQHVKAKPGEEPSYDYKLTKYIGKKTYVEDHNIEKMVTEKFENFVTDLLFEIKQYLDADTSHVKSESARTTLIQHFTKDETNRIGSAVKKHIETGLLGAFNQTDVVDVLHAMDHELQRIQSLLNENSTLQEHLNTRQRACNSAPFSELLTLHPLLLKELQANTEQGLDDAYSRMPLPEEFTGKKLPTNNVAIVKVKKALDDVIQANRTILEEQNPLIQQSLDNLADHRHKTFLKWKQDVLQTAVIHTEKHTQILNTCQQELVKINTTGDEVVYGNIVSLEEAIETCKQQSSQRVALLARQVPNFEKTQQLYQLSPKAAQLDSDHSLQRALAQTGQPLLDSLTSLVKQIETDEWEQKITLFRLQSHLEKARSQALFLENMRSLDPVKIRELKIAADDHVIQAQNRKADAERQMESTAREIDEIKNSLAICHTEISTKQQSIEKLDNANSVLFGNVLDFCAHHEIIENPPALTDLIKDSKQAEATLKNVEHLLIQLHQKQLHNIYTPEYYRKLKKMLSSVEQCLVNNKEPSIPFSQIENLPCFKEWSKKITFGFHDFLVLIDQESACKDWIVFRARQDDLSQLFNRPSAEEFAKKLVFLKDKIAAKLKDLPLLLNNSKQADLSMKATLEFKNSLPKIREQVESNFFQKSVQESIIENLKVQADDIGRSASALTEQLEQQGQTLKQLEADNTQQEYQRQILAESIEILEGIESCKEKIDLFTQSGEYAYTNDALYQTIVNLQSLHTVLARKFMNALKTSRLLSNADVFKTSLDSLANLLGSTCKDIATTLRIKLNLNPLELQMNSLTGRYSELNTDYLLLADLEDEAALARMMAMLEKFGNLSESLVQQSTIIEMVNQGLSKISDTEYHDKIASILLSKNTLKENITILGELLLDDLHKRLNHYHADAAIFTNPVRPEQVANQKTNADILVSIRARLSQFPDNETLARLASAVSSCSDTSKTPAKLDAIKLARKNVEERLLHSETVNKNVLQRISERSNLVDTLLLTRLDDYLRARKEAHKIQDAITAHEKDKREQLVDTLKLQLEDFKISGDSQYVLQTIKDNMASVPGLHFRTLLNKISIELLDCDRKVPVDYLNEITPPVNEHELAHDNARVILRELKKTHPKYVRAICNMYNQVFVMQNFKSDPEDALSGQAFNQFADKLRYDLDRFIIAHPDTLPTKNAYRTFRDNFTTRLHSEDDVHGIHRAAWKHIVLNVLIGLATLGVAIGVKILHSKINTGRCSFFFSETKRQEHIALLDELVTNRISAGAA